MRLQIFWARIFLARGVVFTAGLRAFSRADPRAKTQARPRE
jgi:hypothetical protein